jgi:ABC-type polysaccharide/polyol phosphate transport system ATPase subunit
VNEDITVSVRDLRKKFRLFSTPMERLKESFHPLRKRYHKEFWALNGISFDIPKGEVLGILGRNGSGKSTLLQIIASVLQPTSGTVTVNGRVSALLELGAGFNPEFTGRQNVLLNGAIMGVPIHEMLERIPAIIDFADIGEFFDQPMKIYSSGMFVRVAFAAATSVDPDILIVDEALAVGDAKFQYRCFQKIKEFKERGTTIVLVTHDTELVIRHCENAILLNEGYLIAHGAPETVVRQYIDLMEERDLKQPAGSTKISSAAELGAASGQRSVIGGRVEEIINAFLVDRPNADQCARRTTYNPTEHAQKDPRAEIVDYLIVSADGVDPTRIMSGETIDIYFKVRFHADIECPCFGIALNSKDGVQIYALNSAWTLCEPIPARAGDLRVVRFRMVLRLNSGDVFIDLGVDERRDVNSYANIFRRMGLIHLVIHSNKLFHGLANLDADFSDQVAGCGVGVSIRE